jgi:hypothetical protein
MRRPTLLVLFALGLLVRGDSSDSCFVPSESNLEISGTCKSKNVTLFSEKDSFTINFNGTGSERVMPDMTLKIGGCKVNAILILLSGEGVLNFGKNRTLTFPITATVSNVNIRFVGAAPKKTTDVKPV